MKYFKDESNNVYQNPILSKHIDKVMTEIDENEFNALAAAAREAYSDDDFKK